MRKVLSYVISISSVLLFSAQVAYASGLGSIPNPSRYGSFEEIVNVLGGLVRPIVVLVFIAMLMYGGWVRLTARDDPKKVESSSKIMTAAIAGFAIVVLAPVIVQFVGSLLGVQGGILNFGGTGN